MPEVKQERTGWRDAGLSQRHRMWGWDCPAVDLDFLLLEYDRGKASAIVEYKNEHASPQLVSHPSYQAMIDLGNRAGIPVIACRYKDDFSLWRAVPLNAKAAELIPNPVVLTEKQWVSLMYRIRGYSVPQSVLDGIDTKV